MSTRFVVALAALLAVGPAVRAEERPRLDDFGDPLPERAVARIGTVRLRQPSQVREGVGFGRALSEDLLCCAGVDEG